MYNYVSLALEVGILGPGVQNVVSLKKSFAEDSLRPSVLNDIKSVVTIFCRKNCEELLHFLHCASFSHFFGKKAVLLGNIRLKIEGLLN